MFRPHRPKQFMNDTNGTRTNTAGTVTITNTNTSTDTSSCVNEHVLISYPPPSLSKTIGSMTDNIYNNNINIVNQSSILGHRASATSSTSTTTSTSSGIATTSRGTTHIAASTAGGNRSRNKKGLERSLQHLLLSNNICYYNNDMKNTVLIKQQLIPLLSNTIFGSGLYPAIVVGNGMYLTEPTKWIDYFEIDFKNDNHIVSKRNITFPKEMRLSVQEQTQQRNNNLCNNTTCLVLSGMIPYYYKDNTYNQYIDIFLPYPSFPLNPPKVFVRKRDTPTITTEITETAAPSVVSTTEEIFSDRNQQIDRKTGEVYSNYLSGWDVTTTRPSTRSSSHAWSTLIGLIQQLSSDFSKQPPVRTVLVADTNTSIQPTTTTTTTSIVAQSPSPSPQIPAAVANEHQQPQQNLSNDSNTTMTSLPIPEQVLDSNQQQQIQQQQYPLHYDMTGIYPTVSPIQSPPIATSLSLPHRNIDFNSDSTTASSHTVDSPMIDFYNDIRLQLQLKQSELCVAEKLALYRANNQRLVQQLHHVQMSTKVVDETLNKVDAQQQSYRAIISQQQHQQPVAMTNGCTTGNNNVNNIQRRSLSFAPLEYTFSCADMLRRNIVEIVNKKAHQDNMGTRQSSITEPTNNSITTLIKLNVDVVDEQLILLEAEDSAYQDLISVINYAFRNDFLSSENYFTLLRKVAKQHFYVRAYKVIMIRKRRIP